MLKLHTIRLFIVIAALAIAPFQARAGQPSSTVREDYEKAWNTKDPTAVAALYANDAILVANGTKISGRDNIEKHFSEAIKNSTNFELKSTKTEDSKGGIHDSGTLQYNMPASLRIGADAEVRIGDGAKLGIASRQVKGTYSFTAERDKDKWVISEHVWNESK